jgi:hypothetical protein
LSACHRAVIVLRKMLFRALPIANAISYAPEIPVQAS